MFLAYMIYGISYTLYAYHNDIGLILKLRDVEILLIENL